MRVLVTGGCGYIGSHTITELVAQGHDVAILDNFTNSSRAIADQLRRITNTQIHCFDGDVRDGSALDAAFADFPVDAVIHFAALKAVGESCKRPLKYFDNNIGGTITLLQSMARNGIKWLVFSSSATVYGVPKHCPITEDAPLRVTNPYGRTKLVMEQLIGDIAASDPAFHPAILRYFNPVGAHPSGDLGEDPRGVPNNLMPFICQVATRQRDHLNIFGNDYPTPDGTGVRDYIHVMDLARAHVAALHALANGTSGFTVNLGTGRGYSVLEMVRAFEHASGRRVPYHIAPRRGGDVAMCYADPSRAEALLAWRAELGLDRMCEDAWHWQSRHPRGYRD